MSNLVAMKKPDLIKLCTKLRQELKMQEKSSGNISLDNLPHFALTYYREGDEFKAFIIKVNLDTNQAMVYKTVTETTKELALYKLELSIIDYLENQSKGE